MLQFTFSGTTSQRFRWFLRQWQLSPKTPISILLLIAAFASFAFVMSGFKVIVFVLVIVRWTALITLLLIVATLVDRRPMTVTISPSGIQLIGGNGRMPVNIGWDDVRSVRETDGGVFVDGKRLSCFIPGYAFNEENPAARTRTLVEPILSGDPDPFDTTHAWPPPPQT